MTRVIDVNGETYLYKFNSKYRGECDYSIWQAGAIGCCRIIIPDNGSAYWDMEGSENTMGPALDFASVIVADRENI